MSITENLMAIGSWGVTLRRDVPLRILEKLEWFGHLAVTEAREDVRISGDAILDSARYVGVYRGISDGGEGPSLSGAGMALWLGDEENKGHVYEQPVTFVNKSFQETIAGLLPPSVQVGTLHSVNGLYTGTHHYQSPRQAIDYVCSTMNGEWRLNGNGTLDAGKADDLYGSTPRAAVIRRARGTSSQLKALPGTAKVDTDMEDYTTRVVMLAAQTETQVATGAADINPALNPHLDLFGNPVKMTRLVSESSTSEGNADVRAQLQLNRFTGTRDAVTVNSDSHHIEGDLAVGEWAWCYDPDAGLYDYNNEVQWQGETIHPVKLRITALTWPLAEGAGVYFRTPAGEWIDLTDFVNFEAGQTTVTVGGYNRSLTATGGESVSARLSNTPQPNTTTPVAPTWNVPFRQTVYMSPVSGQSRVQVDLDWDVPLNTDGTPVSDGDYYEIRYRTTSQAILAATHQQLSMYTHDELNTHEDPIPFVTSGWAYVRASWETTNYILADLMAGTPYEFQVRAVDNGTPANPSDWSLSVITQTTFDNIAPQTPAAPFVAGNPLSVMIQHRLGIASGGEYNLDRDLAHLEVHAEYTPHYEPIPLAPQDGGTMIGKATATEAELTSGIPVTASFPVRETGPRYIKVVAVDRAGNRSRPSAAAEVSMTLLDTQYITELNASRISTGTIAAQILMGGLFHTNATGVGADVGFDGMGFFATDNNGEFTFKAGADGTAYMRGTVESGVAGGRRITLAPGFPAIQFWLDTSPQRYVLQPYTNDEPGDPADAPGLQLYGRNQAGMREGARAVWYEDGWYMQVQNAWAAEGVSNGNKGGYIFGSRTGLTVGYEDHGAPDDGWFFFATPSEYYIRSQAPNYRGGYLRGGVNFQSVEVRDAGSLSLSRVYLTDRSITIDPNGSRPNEGYIDVRGGYQSNSSAHIRMMAGTGQGTLIKTWENPGVSVNTECRRWDDAAWATFVCDTVVQASDETGKKDIRDAEKDGLKKIKGLRPRKYRRKKQILPTPNEDDWEEIWQYEEHRGEKRRISAGRKLKDGVLERLQSEAKDSEERLGLVAQEVPADWTVQTSEGLGIDLYAVVTSLVQAVQEQAEINDAQEKRIATLEAQVEALLKATGTDVPKPTKGK